MWDELLTEYHTALVTVALGLASAMHGVGRLAVGFKNWRLTKAVYVHACK